MAGKPLRSQLNQIRAWVRQGRTDAWIAHQLEVSASELREFRRRHGLTPDDEPDGSEDLRDEIEAEVEAATLAADEEEDEEPDEEPDEEEAAADEEEDEDEDGERREEAAGGEGEGGGRRRRRRRRGGRGRRSKGAGAIEATFDHGEKDGYGLWLDPAVTENPIYGEHWAEARAVEVSIEPDRITIRRSGD